MHRKPCQGLLTHEIRVEDLSKQESFPGSCCGMWLGDGGWWMVYCNFMLTPPRQSVPAIQTGPSRGPTVDEEVGWDRIPGAPET